MVINGEAFYMNEVMWRKIQEFKKQLEQEIPSKFNNMFRNDNKMDNRVYKAPN